MNLKTITIFVVLLLMAGCGKPISETTPEQKDTLVQEPVQEDNLNEDQQIPVIGETLPEQADSLQEQPELSSDIIELLDTHKTKVKSAYFQFKVDKDSSFKEVYMKDNKIKIVLPELAKLPGPKYYDTVYINSETKTAIAYCEGKSCDIKEESNKGQVDFVEHYVKTPFDWVSEISSAEKGRSRQIENRDVIELKTNIGVLWIDTFYGLPRQVEYGNHVINYQKMRFNQITDEDVAPKP